MELHGRYKSRSDFGKQAVTMTQRVRGDIVDLTSKQKSFGFTLSLIYYQHTLVWRHVKNKDGKEELVSVHKFSLTHYSSGKNMLTGEILMNEEWNETRGEGRMLKSCLVILGKPPLDSIFIQIKEFRYSILYFQV